MSYDGSPEINLFNVDTINKVWMILRENNNIAGMIQLERMNNIMWNCHVFLFEVYRRNKSEEWAIQAAQYMKERYGARKFLAITPYEAAKKYAERAGFKYVNTITDSIVKNGKLMNQYMMEKSV